jgi:hypothetical protein
VTTFLQVCLYVFAAWVFLGLVPIGVLAAKNGSILLIAVSLLAVGFVIFVLVAAAGDLR